MISSILSPSLALSLDTSWYKQAMYTPSTISHIRGDAHTMVNVLYRPPASAIMFINRSFSIISIVSSRISRSTSYFSAHTFVYFLACSTIVEYPHHPSLLDIFLVPMPDCLSLFSIHQSYSAFAFMCLYNMTPRRNNQFIMSEPHTLSM